MSDANRRGARGGKRVQRGRAAAAAVTRPADTHDPYILTAQALTPAARDLALARMIELNPQVSGAHLDDILSMLDEGDPFLPWSEMWWESDGARLAAELGTGGHDLALSAFHAAVIVLGVMEQTATEQPVSPQLTAMADALARAAAAGRTDAITEAEPEAGLPVEELAAWLAPDGTLRRRSGTDDAILGGRFGCDSCVHPRADHDPETGACLRINPFYGPCPCEHTPEAERAVQQRLFETSRLRR